MDAKQQQKFTAIDVWQVNINWYGKNKLSPEYHSIKEAMDATQAFLKAFKGKYLQVTYVRNQRWVPAG